ncbi:MAG: excinuclease ABC subunit A [Planctomycetes bacterium]|nr:excinuclease ABC subunit A [Planctomycetota bacterium]
MPKHQDLIRVRKASQNNLDGVDLDIPRNQLVGITGVSGSGKSSLAFDTLFREGQRRFLETLSAYARQFLGRMEKPDVESIEGLSPAIAVDQRAISRGARSTVGTLTEIFDHLRVLYARAGRAHCPECERPVASRTREEIVQQVLASRAREAVTILAPIVRGRKGHHRAVLEDMRRRGYVRARIDGEIFRLEDVEELSRYKIHHIEVVVDRLKPDPTKPGRIREAVEQALELGEGELSVLSAEGVQTHSTERSCPGCGKDLPPLEPRLFSFNSPQGSCDECGGLGRVRRAAESGVVRDPSLTIREGCMAVTRARGGALLFPRSDFDFLQQVADWGGFDLDTRWADLSPEAKQIILYGAGDERFQDHSSWEGRISKGKVTYRRRFKGVIPALLRGQDHGPHQRLARKFLTEEVCLACDGSRLRSEALAVKLGGVGIRELLQRPVCELVAALDALQLDKREARIARDLLTEVRRRVRFLTSLGLNYLSLDRGADTLSGGEAQRIRLAAQLGAGLSGVLYVLDEPSIGLHPRDQKKLVGALEELRDGGNTVIVVEHDEATLRAADWLVDVGPGAGQNGGKICAEGVPLDVAKGDGETARLLRGEVEIPRPKDRRPIDKGSVTLRNASGRNLKGLDVEFPLGCLVAVTGVSGSGKSTLVLGTLEPALQRALGQDAAPPLSHDGLEGAEGVEALIRIDSSPIGRTPRSNPATYTGIFTPIRDLFASLPESKQRGYEKGRFSFNVEGGRCESCGGAGAQCVELQFLAPVTVPCEECAGLRFQRETLEVTFKRRSISDVLEMTAEEALEFFKDHPKIAGPLAWMIDVGLGYLRLGQPSTTLSGGEAQRIKLVTHLSKRRGPKTMYLLDEPTTGLHGADVSKLVGALQRLVDNGHTVLVIEHHMDLVAACDYVIDLGPEGGEAGGEVLCAGRPEEVEAASGSYTGAALFGGNGQEPERERRATRAGASEPSQIEIRGARTHNLKSVDVDLPRNKITVVSGLSGSGKSSLALDTLFTEGRRRFVESLSTYARQFLGSRDRPPVERIDGLGPTVAIEARGVRGGPRSTVATATEIHDHLRVLWSRAGEPQCPKHQTPLLQRDASAIARELTEVLSGSKGWVVAPIRGANPMATLRSRLEPLSGDGFVRALIDGVEHRLDEELPKRGREVGVVVDRVTFTPKSRTRIADAVEQAARLADGEVWGRAQGGEGLELSLRGSCPECGFRLKVAPEPRHFSFNTHAGACEVCDGLGEVMQCDPDLLVTAPERSLFDGAIEGKVGRYLTKGKGFYELLLREVFRAHRIDVSKPFGRLTEKQKALLLFGEGAKESYTTHKERSGASYTVDEEYTAEWPGLCGHVDGWHANASDPGWVEVLEEAMDRRKCRGCKGERLKPEWRAVTLDGMRLPACLKWDVSHALSWLHKLDRQVGSLRPVEPVLEELQGRLEMLERVGLGYVGLDRRTSTLSGGEARRVALAAGLGSQLVGVCYVLDEPTVGLHPSDVDRLMESLEGLRERGNSVVLVEHDERVVRRADWVVDLGPGAGEHGGKIVCAGTPADVQATEKSATGAALRGELNVPPREERSASQRQAFQVTGANTHNLNGVDLKLNWGELLGVCGPSGSGKSSLVIETVLPALKGEPSRGRWSRFRGRGAHVVLVDASPIGATPSSVPATYSGVMDHIRGLYSRTTEASALGFGPAHFSFNSSRGRCPACDGNGATRVELQFLPDLWLTCDECDGSRYRPEVLGVRWRGKTVADVLGMSVDEAIDFFAHQPRILGLLQSMADVGMGYLRLGQPANTLSGGEAQRMKLAAELSAAQRGLARVILLDEPTTGLHAKDVQRLMLVLQKLADAGHALIMIEHDPAALCACDRLVELGPGGGDDGGVLVAEGTPKDLHNEASSPTGPWLGAALAGAVQEPKQRRRRRGKAGSGSK